MTSYSLNGIPIAPWNLLRGTTHTAALGVRRAAVVVPGMHGVLPVGAPVAEPRQMLFRIAPATDAGAEALEALVADVMSLWFAPSLTVTRTSGSSVTEVDARLIQIDWPPEGISDERVVATITVELPGVFWRDTTATTTALVAGSTALDVGSAPVTDAVIRFALDAANPILTDAQTGTGISVAHDAVATDYIYVDCGQLRAWKSASSSQWTRPASSAAWLDALVSYPGPGPLRMTPAVTESGGVLSRRATLTSSHTASVRFKKAWW